MRLLPSSDGDYVARVVGALRHAVEHLLARQQVGGEPSLTIGATLDRMIEKGFLRDSDGNRITYTEWAVLRADAHSFTDTDMQDEPTCYYDASDLTHYCSYGRGEPRAWRGEV